MALKNLNLGCGPVFVDSAEWLNLDFSPVSQAVKGVNLLGRLPLSDSAVAVVYSSHFIEHVPKPGVPAFLRECWRVLAPGGHIRLVLPDLENMAREYLQCREAGDHDKADFLVLEMVDQCVRRESGGELGRFYQQLRGQSGERQAGMIDFVRERVGEDLRMENVPSLKLLEGQHQWRRIPAALRNRIARYWIRLCLFALPSAFRAQNISLAAVGERHQWLWDFHQLAAALEAAGFTAVQRQTADCSGIAAFPFHLLDLDATGRPRKGAESMYIEAHKPPALAHSGFGAGLGIYPDEWHGR